MQARICAERAATCIEVGIVFLRRKVVRNI